MRITMIGSGYVGLVSGACFSDFGHDVICVDKDAAQDRRAASRARCRSSSRASTQLVATQRRARAGCPSPPISPSAVAGADAVFIAVGTPSRRGDGHADLTYVFAAAEEIAAAVDRADGGRHQVDRAGRHRRRGRADPRARRARTSTIAVVSNPEFLREGAAIGDFKRPDRIVIGTEDERAREVMREVYRPLYLNESADPVHRPAHAPS